MIPKLFVLRALYNLKNDWEPPKVLVYVGYAF